MATEPEPRHNRPPPPDAGLCGGCAHAAAVATRRGSVFLRCGLHDSDPRFAKYPPLPLRACPGFLGRTEGERRG